MPGGNQATVTLHESGRDVANGPAYAGRLRLHGAIERARTGGDACQPDASHAIARSIAGAVGEPIALWEPSNRWWYANPSLDNLLHSSPRPNLLEAALREVAAATARRADNVIVARDAASELHCHGLVYHVHATWLAADRGTPGLAVLRVCHPMPRGIDAVANRARLTRQQVRVAGLIVRGFTNAEIARELFISPHTARHHVEQILLKLGARSRGHAIALLTSHTATFLRAV
jgi:DNA-binding CsgD family transcriptional regulator